MMATVKSCPLVDIGAPDIEALRLPAARGAPDLDRAHPHHRPGLPGRSSTRSANKWLMVLDQVGYATLEAALAPPARSSLVPLELTYLPRTTPVGHATISTGAWPSQHLIQGRSWCEVDRGRIHRVHRVSQLPHLFPVAGTVFEDLQASSLARRLRREADPADTAIVAIATKDFIPFLFGAWDTDVSVYPRTTSPLRIAGEFAGEFAIDVVFDTFTVRGAIAVAAARSALLAQASALFVAAPSAPGTWAARWLDPTPGLLGPAHVRHAMRWTLPRSWGATEPRIRHAWKRFLDARILDIDAFYVEAAHQLLSGIDAGRRIVLQSAVATDTYGHFHGPSSLQYQRALAAGIGRAEALHAAGWTVLVTSDHGGRDTPSWWRATGHTLSSGTAAVALPPALRVVLEGDHVVGYGSHADAFLSRASWSTVPPLLVPIAAIPGALRANSFHATQTPAWVVLPGPGALITDAPILRGGGGSHGGCVDAAGDLSEVDGQVPLW
ncbi:MAG TPA: hypothetical protein VF469_03205, partial [Kofleriaceae bacterium]